MEELAAAAHPEKDDEATKAATAAAARVGEEEAARATGAEIEETSQQQQSTIEMTEIAEGAPGQAAVTKPIEEVEVGGASREQVHRAPVSSEKRKKKNKKR